MGERKQGMAMDSVTGDHQADTRDSVQTTHSDPQQPPPSHSADHDTCDSTLHNPVDTGWAWVIMISVFVIQVISVGMLRSLGVLFVAIQARFQTSVSTVSVIGSVVSASLSLTAVFCMSILLELTSIRRATVIGGFIGTCGLVVSFFATTVSTLFFSFAVCLGVGMGMCMAPGYILLNMYFRKKRPLATAMANTGGSVGSIIMPLVTRMFLDTYLLPGTLLMLGGIFAQTIIFGSLFTPPSDYVQRKSLYHGKDVPNDEQELKYETQMHVLVRGHHETQNSRSTRSESLASENELQKCLDDCEVLTKNLPTETLPSVKNSLLSVNEQHTHLFSYQTPKQKEYGLWKDRLSVDNLLLAVSLGGSPAISLVSLDKAHKGLVRENSGTVECKDDDEKLNELSDDCILQRPVLYACKTFRVCEPSMYRSVVFWLLFVYHFAASFVCLLPSVYLPALAQEKGLTLTQGALLLTIYGALDIASRLVPGALAQSELVKPQISVAVSLLVLGVIFQFTAALEGMAAMVVMSVVYGLFSGVFFSMLQLIILDFSDLSKFRQVFSITQLALGGSGVTGYPIVGCLRDMSSSYALSFHFMGACGLFASALLLLLSSLQARERVHARDTDSAAAVSDTDQQTV